MDWFTASWPEHRLQGATCFWNAYILTQRKVSFIRLMIINIFSVHSHVFENWKMYTVQRESVFQNRPLFWLAKWYPLVQGPNACVKSQILYHAPGYDHCRQNIQTLNFRHWKLLNQGKSDNVLFRERLQKYLFGFQKQIQFGSVRRQRVLCLSKPWMQQLSLSLLMRDSAVGDTPLRMSQMINYITLHDSLTSRDV